MQRRSDLFGCKKNAPIEAHPVSLFKFIIKKMSAEMEEHHGNNRERMGEHQDQLRVMPQLLLALRSSRILSTGVRSNLSLEREKGSRRCRGRNFDAMKNPLVSLPLEFGSGLPRTRVLRSTSTGGVC